MGVQEKQLVKRDGFWKPSETGLLEEGESAVFIAYQVPEEGYHARTFEDAFIHINHDFIKDNIQKFKGLKNLDRFKDSHDEDGAKDAYSLSVECIEKKTHFAMDIFYLGGSGQDAKWKTPFYIKEGLRWLRDVK